MQDIHQREDEEGEIVGWNYAKKAFPEKLSIADEGTALRAQMRHCQKETRDDIEENDAI